MLLVVLIRSLVRVQEGKKGVVEREVLVEKVSYILVHQSHPVEVIGVLWYVVRTAPLQMQQARYGFLGSHKGRVACVRVGGALGGRGSQVIVLFVYGEALGLRPPNAPTEALNLLLHFGMLRSLSNALEVGLDLALKLQALTPRAALERILDDIAAELQRSQTYEY